MKQDKNVVSAPIATPAAAYAESIREHRVKFAHKWDGEPSIAYDWSVAEFAWDDPQAVQGLILAAGQHLGNVSDGKLRNPTLPIDHLVKFCRKVEAKKNGAGSATAADKKSAEVAFEKVMAHADENDGWIKVEAKAQAFGLTLTSRDMEGLIQFARDMRAIVES